MFDARRNHIELLGTINDFLEGGGRMKFLRKIYTPGPKAEEKLFDSNGRHTGLNIGEIYLDTPPSIQNLHKLRVE